MIQSKEDLNYYIFEDKKRNLGNISYLTYWAEKLYNTDRYMAFNYLRALRKYEYSMNVQCKTLYGRVLFVFRKLIWRRLTIKYNIMLPPNVIGPGFKMAHIVGGGIIINCKSIGRNCSANAGVVVGNSGSQDKIAVIGDNVSLTIGCKVIGKVTIGNNVIVAPNSVVVKDIPDNCIVSGIPATIIKQNGTKVRN